MSSGYKLLAEILEEKESMPQRMEPGDILTHTDSFGIVRRWRVCGVYLGAEGQESVVEIVSVSHACPTADGFAVPMYVPEILLRDLTRKWSGESNLTERPAGRA